MNIKQTVPFNFDEIYESIKVKFEEKGYDSIYDGSNTAQLITAMSYLTSMLNVNTAVNINETILTLANKRNNILTDARILGYEIAHIGSYIYEITLEFTEGSYTIPKYSKFSGSGNTYHYLDNDIDIVVQSGQTHQETIRIKEGDMMTFEEYPDILYTITKNILNDEGEVVPQYYIDVPIENVEDNGLEVFLTYYDQNGILHENEPWSKSDKFMIDKDSALDKEYIRLDNIEYKMPRIYFKFAGVGEGIRTGTIVEINALVSKGIDGKLEGTLATSIDATIIDVQLKQQGSEEEASQSIKDNAPLFHNSANRAVTKSDYIAICTRHNTVEETEVWGGDDEYPKVPGHVWFSFSPSTLIREYTHDEFKLEFVLDNPEDLVNWYIEDDEIESTTYDANGDLLNPGVWDVLGQYKIPTLIYHNRHPLYIDFNYNLNIMKYNIQTSKADIHQEAFDVINNYFEGINEPIVLESFDVEYFHSNLEKRIDTELTDITGFNNTLVTKIMLNSKTLIQEHVNQDNYNIIVPLGVPFESYFDAGDLLPNILPSIDTLDFLGTGDDLVTDWSSLTGSEEDMKRISAPIKLGNTIVGEYMLFNDSRRDIVVTIFVKNDGGVADVPLSEYDESTILTSHFNNTVYMDLNYYSPNFAIIKNCIPRLNTVTFS